MDGDKYVIMYDWRAPRGVYTFCGNWSANSFIRFIIKFIRLSFRYDIIDVNYRNFRD